MPAYNHAHFLERAIQSVLSQTYKEWELIIVDNHSTDQTDAVIASFNEPRIKLFKINNEGIVAKSRNLGIKMALGEFIAFLDSDDWWLSNKLAVSMKFLNLGADVVYHDLFFVQNENDPKKKKIKCRPLKKPVFEALLTKGNVINNSSVVVRSELLHKAGLLDEQKGVIASEDYDLWVRVALYTDKFYMINECLGFYWYVGANLSKNKDQSLAGAIILEKHKHKLSQRLLSKANAYLMYTAACFLINANKKKDARKLFLQSLRKGNRFIKTKSIYRLAKLFI